MKELRAGTAGGLVAVIEKALAREVDKRWQNIGELVQALSPYARLDTRARIEGLLRQHAPLLKLLPPAALATTAAQPSARAASKAGAPASARAVTAGAPE